MAAKPKRNISKKRRRVKKKRRMISYKKRAKKAKKRAKKKRSKKKVSKKVIRQTIEMIRQHPELFPEFVVPQRKKKKRRARIELPDDRDVEMVAEQVAQRIQEKIIGPGFEVESTETQIMAALIAAEQAGTLNEEYYIQADEHGWSPQEVYQFWIYN